MWQDNKCLPLTQKWLGHPPKQVSELKSYTLGNHKPRRIQDKGHSHMTCGPVQEMWPMSKACNSYDPVQKWFQTCGMRTPRIIPGAQWTHSFTVSLSALCFICSYLRKQKWTHLHVGMHFSVFTVHAFSVHVLGSMKIFELKKGSHTQREWKLQMYSIHKIVTEFIQVKNKCVVVIQVWVWAYIMSHLLRNKGYSYIFIELFLEMCCWF
jgi:hypothetical protein